MKRTRAIGHIAEIAELATDGLRFRKTTIGWPLEQMWVTGDLLSLADTIEAGSVVLVLDLPSDELPWLALHPIAESVGHQLALGKRPIQWCYRPLAWPAWTYEHRRVVKCWSADAGPDTTVFEALRSRRLDRLTIVEPSAEELATQLRKELPASRNHLRAVVDAYWDRDWRRSHKGYDESPEDHLWRAATAVSEMWDALEEVEHG